MFALPVIERELRVRARRKSTFWLRIIAALLASLTAASTLSWAQYYTWGPWRPGKTLFDSLSALAFVFCLVEGVRQTADCLSQEKRDGTLGLLFLTDLSGFDIVLGKFAAASLGSFYALLAVFPAMAAALPAGGLTAGEFWRTQLVLLNTLFFALACGLWASARHCEENRTLMAGLKVSWGLTLLPVVLEFLLRRWSMPSPSPGVAMYLAGDTAYVTQPARFWMTLLFIHLLGWTLLALAGRNVSERWRDDAEEPQETTREKRITEANKGNEGGRSFTEGRKANELAAETDPFTPSSFSSLPSVTEYAEPTPRPIESAWPYIDTGLSHSPATARRDWRPSMEVDPAAWLAARLPAHRKVITVSILILALASLSPVLLNLGIVPGVSGIFSAIARAAAIVPLLLLAFVSSRPLAETRRGGALELLLATPLSPDAIVRGHWQALWGELRRPLTIALILLAGLFALSVLGSLGRTGSPSYALFFFLRCGQQLLAAYTTCWLGLYLGLRTRSAMMAVGLNLLLIVVVPWVADSFFWLSTRLFFSTVFTAALPWWYGATTLGWSAVDVGYLWGVLRWSRRQLSTRFRELAAQP
jgi:hypothetical protein